MSIDLILRTDFIMDHTKNHFQPIEACSHHHTAHYRSKVNPKMKEEYCRPNDSSLYQDSPVRSHKKCYERNQPPINDTSQVKWSRNNIALTMEYFQPMSSTSTPKRYSNQSDYSYAYYEPGAAMRHSNIPKMLTDRSTEVPSTTRSSPKSIRSLLCKPNDEQQKSNTRHTYTTRYGTQENIYEDVSTIRIRPDSFESPDTPTPVNGKGSKIEFQDILHNHYRVLEELNLSVEEMLLSTTKKTNALSPRKMLKRSTKSRNKVRNANAVSPKNAFASSMNDLIVGEDSGFSGSSSGASYIGIGGLRNYKTALTRSNRNSTEINYSNNGSDCGTLQGVINVKNRNDSQTLPLQMIKHSKGDKCSVASKGFKFSFWNSKR